MTALCAHCPRNHPNHTGCEPGNNPDIFEYAQQPAPGTGGKQELATTSLWSQYEHPQISHPPTFTGYESHDGRSHLSAASLLEERTAEVLVPQVFAYGYQSQAINPHSDETQQHQYHHHFTAFDPPPLDAGSCPRPEDIFEDMLHSTPNFVESTQMRTEAWVSVVQNEAPQPPSAPTPVWSEDTSPDIHHPKPSRAFSPSWVNLDREITVGQISSQEAAGLYSEQSQVEPVEHQLFDISAAGDVNMFNECSSSPEESSTGTLHSSALLFQPVSEGVKNASRHSYHPEPDYSQPSDVQFGDLNLQWGFQPPCTVPHAGGAVYYDPSGMLMTSHDGQLL